MLSVHVDDQLIACSSRWLLDDFKHRLDAAFENSDSGAANYFLGFDILRDRSVRKMRLSQRHYLDTLLERYNMADCNPTVTPLPSGFHAIKATD